jgi:hypothetical protein
MPGEVGNDLVISVWLSRIGSELRLHEPDALSNVFQRIKIMRTTIVIGLVAGLLLTVGCQSDDKPAKPKPKPKPSAAQQGFEQLGRMMAEGFGQALKEGFSQAEEESAPLLISVNDAEFEAMWRVNLKVDDQPAGEVLGPLFEELGLKFKPSDATNAALAKSVSLDLEDVNRFAAIEEVCAQVGVYPEYAGEGGVARFVRDDDNSASEVTIIAGKRPLPVAFAGPFVVLPESVDEWPPWGTGRVALLARTAALPPIVAYLVKENRSDTLTLERVEGPAGKRIPAEATMWIMPSAGEPWTDSKIDVKLTHLLRDVESLAAVYGGLLLRLPHDVAVLKIEDVSAGATASEGPLKVVLKKVEAASDGTRQLQFEVTGRETEEKQFWAIDAAGERTPLEISYESSFGEQSQVALTAETLPVAIEIRLATTIIERNYPFVLTDVPLSRFAEQPESLPELTFPGDVPLTLAMKGFAGKLEFRELKIEITNHTNKPALKIEFTSHYLDASGKELKDWPSNESGPVDFQTSRPNPLVKAGATVTVETMAFFMPDETKTARFTLKSVEFADGTEWRVEEPADAP